MGTKRVKIIPALHGKLTRDGKLSEPDIYYILKRWLERHPSFVGREQEFRIDRSRWTLREGIRTEVITVSAIETEDIAGYDPAYETAIARHIARLHVVVLRSDRGVCRR